MIGKKKSSLISGLFLCLSLLCVSQADAQKKKNSEKWEIGGWIGMSNYSGDLSQPQGNLGAARLGGGLFTRYRYSKSLAFRAGGDYGYIRGSDLLSSDADRRRRGFDFISHIADGYVVGELNLFTLGRTGRTPAIFYLFGGINIFNFNPKTTIDGEKVELQPLGTEGQGLPDYLWKQPYKLTQFGFPVGFGLHWKIGQRVALSIEYRYNLTTTDKLDDVGGSYPDPQIMIERGRPLAARLSDRSIDPFNQTSTRVGEDRGNPDSYDRFIFLGVGLTYNFREIKCDSFF